MDNLSELMKRQGYEVMPVEDGRQARDAKKENPSDLIGVREVRDGEGNIVTICSTGRPMKEGYDDSEEAKLEKAWKLLQNMIIDNRKWDSD